MDAMQPGGSSSDAGRSEPRDAGWHASREGSEAFKAARREIPGGLAALEARVTHDLACLNYPAPDWVPPRVAADGQQALDVLMVGGGMCGQTAAFALLREGVRKLRVIDRAAPGHEGPWGTFARMETLRSPKHLTSPDLGVPSLTFRAWYEARFGEDGWSALYKVLRTDWLDYLGWVRRQTGVPLENGTLLRSLRPADNGLLEASIEGPSGMARIHARKVVLALGREGSGAARWPRFASFDPGRAAPDGRIFHASEPIDFNALRGLRVGVLGAGASAFDNAGLALESGAASVEMFVRRPVLPQVNKAKGAGFPGFFHGFRSLPDEARWRLYTYIFDAQVPPPFESVLRCDRHPGFRLWLGEGWEDLRMDTDGVRVVTAAGTRRFDAVIVATGFDVDLLSRPELSGWSEQILVWGDRVASAEARRHEEAARFPYLGDGFQLQARSPEAEPTLSRIHVFNWGATMSHSALSGDIPGLAIGAGRLAAAIARDLFVEDALTIEANLYALRDAELAPTRWFVPEP